MGAFHKKWPLSNFIIARIERNNGRSIINAESLTLARTHSHEYLFDFSFCRVIPQSYIITLLE